MMRYSAGKNQADTLCRTEWIGKVGAGVDLFRRKNGDIGKVADFYAAATR